jgi:hypothetical protein
VRRHRLLAGLATAGLLGALAPVATAAQSPAVAGRDDTTNIGSSIEDHLADQFSGAEAQRFAELQREAAQDAAREASQAPGGNGNGRGSKDDSPEANPGPEPEQDATADELVGLEREWLALDDTQQTPGTGATFGYYEKNYRLAAVGEHIEVWVAVGGDASYDDASGTYTLPFATPDDCRNTIEYDGQTRVEVTPEQINQLVADFDLNIYPLETGALATPPDRDGSGAQYNLYNQFVFGGAFTDRDAGYFTTGEDGGQRTVALIDNVRDDNYYTPPNVDQLSYIAGFFSSFYNAAFDRNVMTIDAYDWLHRTGANPPDDASTDPCEGAAARPFLYEGTFAHEWQHLLQSYVGGESTWVNEGLSDWVQTLTGYVDPSQQIDEPEYDSHIQCFTGFLAEFSQYNQTPRETSGPENSLTWWQDQGPGEILCDYGAAYTFMEYVYGQFGQSALQFLFGAPEAGLAGVDAMLDDQGDPRSAQEFLHDWTGMVALDGALDANGRSLRGGSANTYSAPTLHSVINWDENDAYDTPGAPPNGSDYVRLRDGAGSYVAGDDVSSLSFTGSATADPSPVQWTSVEPDDREGSALYSGAGNGLDHTMAFPVTVPGDDPTLTFDTKFAIEYGWDYGFVQVSTDGGQSWTSLSNSLTNSDNSVGDGYYDQIVEQLPGIGGISVLDPSGVLTASQDPTATPQWGTTSFDLSAYAGQDVLVGFRYMTDGAAVLPGWWVDDVMVGDTLVTDGSLEGASSYEELAPPPVAGWHLTVLGYASDGSAPAAIRTFEVAPGGNVTMSAGALRPFRGLDTVAAVVTQDEPTEQQFKYAPYELTVNGVLQPGGS